VLRMVELGVWAYAGCTWELSFSQRTELLGREDVTHMHPVHMVTFLHRITTKCRTHPGMHTRAHGLTG